MTPALEPEAELTDSHPNQSGQVGHGHDAPRKSSSGARSGAVGEDVHGDGAICVAFSDARCTLESQFLPRFPKSDTTPAPLESRQVDAQPRRSDMQRVNRIGSTCIGIKTEFAKQSRALSSMSSPHQVRPSDPLNFASVPSQSGLCLTSGSPVAFRIRIHPHRRLAHDGGINNSIADRDGGGEGASGLERSVLGVSRFVTAARRGLE